MITDIKLHHLDFTLEEVSPVDFHYASTLGDVQFTQNQPNTVYPI